MTQKDQKQYNDSTCGTASHIPFLVEKARDGSRDAFEDLVVLFKEDIFRMVYYRTRSRMDAEDIAQDVFIQAFKNLSRLRETKRFRGWLFSIALNRIRDFHRKKKFWNLSGIFDNDNEIDQADSEIHENPEALDNLLKKDFWKHIGSFLDKLPRMEKEVFILRFMDHLSIKEISLVLKKHESTVKTHLYRALEKFRACREILQLLEEETR
jgi:RNA polymerase sigma-70 factor (ECF subfamily)